MEVLLTLTRYPKRGVRFASAGAEVQEVARVVPRAVVVVKGHRHEVAAPARAARVEAVGILVEAQPGEFALAAALAVAAPGRHVTVAVLPAVSFATWVVETMLFVAADLLVTIWIGVVSTGIPHNPSEKLHTIVSHPTP